MRATTASPPLRVRVLAAASVSARRDCPVAMRLVGAETTVMAARALGSLPGVLGVTRGLYTVSAHGRDSAGRFFTVRVDLGEVHNV